MSRQYDEEYFTTSNYSNYLERRERYISLAREIVELLSQIGAVSQDDVILDYGCAVGFLMEGIRDMGYHKVYGYDVSEWAISQARDKGLTVVDELGACDVLMSLDVFEHMEDDQIRAVLDDCDADVLVGRIPCADTNQSDFYLEISRQDDTHINCKDKRGWLELLASQGYNTVLPLHLYTIYDSTGVMSFVAFHKDSRFLL